MLTCRRAGWSEFLSRFDFKLCFRPGKRAGKPDALTRRPGDLPEGGDERHLHQFQTLLKPELLTLNALLLPSDTFEQLMETAYKVDPFPQHVMRLLNERVQHSREISLADCTIQDDQLYFRSKLFVPDYDPLRLHILQNNHDHPAAGHPGLTKTFDLMDRKYYWPGMRNYIKRYIQHCQTCPRIKASRHAPYELLKPLEIPDHPWNDLSMDFITGLPLSDNYNAILVVVDRLTKMAHFIPCRDDTTSVELAELYHKNVWKAHGIPKSIVSDRGQLFISSFWKDLTARLKIESRLSTAFHPETDGQTERTNAILEQYLRAYVNYQQNDWNAWLPQAEFAHNNHISKAIGTSCNRIKLLLC